IHASLRFSFYSDDHHLDLHSFPTRRSSDLKSAKSFFDYLLHHFLLDWDFQHFPRLRFRTANALHKRRPTRASGGGPSGRNRLNALVRTVLPTTNGRCEIGRNNKDQKPKNYKSHHDLNAKSTEDLPQQIATCGANTERGPHTGPTLYRDS